MTKKDAAARNAAWRLALAEGRVVSYDSGMQMRSYPTAEAALQAVADADPDLKAKIVRVPS